MAKTKKTTRKPKIQKRPQSHIKFEIAIAITLVISIIFLLSSIFVLQPSVFLGDISFRVNDKDNDYLSDQLERRFGTNEYKADTDGDGLTDGAEVNTYGTDPLHRDTDLDGLPDITEVMWGSDPLDVENRPPDYGFEKDTDADGISDEAEIDLGTNPNNIDSDGDKLSDGEEVNTHLTDPLHEDTDRDYLTDGAEVRWGLNPREKDTDGDRKMDSDEVLDIGTNPFIADPEEELYSIFMPLHLLPFQRAYGEEIIVEEEEALEEPEDFDSHCNFHAMEFVDSDGDHLADDMEIFFATSPNNDDTDGDGYKDGDEIRNGFDPKIPLPDAYLFKDITEDWQHRAVGEIAYIVAVQGRLDPLLDIEPSLRRKFEPNDYMTRAEFLKLVISLMEYICDEEFVPADNVYKDLRNTDWYYDVILNATALNLIGGFPDHTIRANQYVNRSEVAKIITVAFALHEYKALQAPRDFRDVSRNDWGYHFIQTIREREITNGYADGTYKPYKPVTRAEAFAMLGKAFNFVNDELYRRLAE